MQGLWRKTSNLFLGQPVLWLPYLGAHWLVSCLRWLRELAQKRIIEWCPASHTILGGAYQDCSASFDFRLELIRFMRAGFEYVDHCVFTVMLVVIAVVAGTILRGQRPTLKTIAGVPRPTASRVLVYSLKIWFLSLVLEVLFIEPSNLLSERLYHSPRWISVALASGQNFLSMVCYVWIMAPLAIALLRPDGAGAVLDEEKKLGRRFFILTGVAAYAMVSILFPLLSAVPIFAPKTVQAFAYGALSPVFGFPNLLGDIALVLLASREDWRPNESKPVWGIQEFLKGLMPHHYSRRDEEP